MLGRSTFNLDRHVRPAMGFLENDPPGCAEPFEGEPAWRSNFKIGSSEGHVGMVLRDEFKGPARAQVDLARRQRLTSRIPPAGDMLRICPSLKNLRARRVEIASQFYRV